MGPPSSRANFFGRSALRLGPSVAVAAAARPAAATTKSTATRTFFTGTGKIHGHRAAVEILAMEHRDSALRLFTRRHLDKAETFRASTGAILDDLRRLHCTCLREQALQISV